MPSGSRVMLALILALALSACASDPSHSSEAVLGIEVTDDRGKALTGVPILIDGERAAMSDARGRAQAIVQGRAGRRVELEPACPPEYRDPTSRSVLLAPRGTRQAELLLRLSCVPLLRTVGVVVRALGGTGLVLRADGEAVATIGADGLAHVLVRRAPESSLRLSLDTGHAPHLAPQFPVREVHVGERDAIVVFDQVFAPAVPARAEPGPKRRRFQRDQARIPYAIGPAN